MSLGIEEAFWSVPSHRYADLWAGIRLTPFPDPSASPLPPPVTSGCANVQELINNPPSSAYAYRTLLLYQDAHCQVPYGLSPLLIDLDLAGGSQSDLDDLTSRLLRHLETLPCPISHHTAPHRSGWYRLFHSGQGYHVEIDPGACESAEAIPEFWYRERIRGLQEDLAAHPLAGRPCIDQPGSPLKLLRIPGSLNEKTGRAKRVLSQDEFLGLSSSH